MTTSLVQAMLGMPPLEGGHPEGGGTDVGIRLTVEVMDHAPDTLTHLEYKVLMILAETARDVTRHA